MQQHEMLAWLGADHGLTAEQVTDLARTAQDIAARYPDPDDGEEREAALVAAYRALLPGQVDALVTELGADLLAARLAEARAIAGLRQAAISVVDTSGGKGVRGARTQAGFAERAGVSRFAVRDWLGLS